MPAAKQAKRGEQEVDEFMALDKWMQEVHKGYKSRLVSKDIPGGYIWLVVLMKSIGGGS